MANKNDPSPASIIGGILLFGWLFSCATRVAVLATRYWDKVSQDQNSMFSLRQLAEIALDIGLFFTVVVTFSFYFKKNVVDEP